MGQKYLECNMISTSFFSFFSERRRTQQPQQAIHETAQSTHVPSWRRRQQAAGSEGIAKSEGAFALLLLLLRALPDYFLLGAIRFLLLVVPISRAFVEVLGPALNTTFIE